MVGVGPDEGGGRRLPQWMVGASVTAQLEKPETTKLKKKNGLLSQTSDPDPKPKKTQRRKESLLVEEESSSLKSSHVLTKCGTKRSKRKEKREAADLNFSVSVDLVPEKKCNRAQRKLPESSASRKSSEEPEIKPLSENDDEDEDDDKDEEELTVEDLVTIAKEYVRKDKTTEQDRASKRNHEQRDKSTEMVLSRNEYQRNTGGAQICIETTARNDASTSTSTLFPESETIISAGGTGDPAQDMLDLFLGPLLKKPVNEKKPDVLSDDVAFSREFEIRDKTDAVKDELAPQATKKKSSFKDKIAMFI